MVYEPQHDPPSEYDGVVEARLRRLAEQEEGEGLADAIDLKQAAFILGVSYTCMGNKLRAFRRNEGQYVPLNTKAINNVLKSLQLAGESCDPETVDTYETENVNNSSQSPSMRKKRKRDDTYTVIEHLSIHRHHDN
jgi:hypothetical protein